MNPQKHIGDGKFPNHYWVYQDATKFYNKDGCLEVYGDEDSEGAFIGEFKTYREAINAADNKAYLPHVVIEDRLSGTIFEQMCIVCPCCKREDYESFPDYRFTKETIEKAGYTFE